MVSEHYLCYLVKSRASILQIEGDYAHGVYS